MKKLLFTTCILLLVLFTGISQTVLDSLKNELENTQGKERLELLLKLCKTVNEKTINWKYRSQYKVIAKEAVILSESLDDISSLGEAYSQLGQIYRYFNNDTSILYLDSARLIFKKLGQEAPLANATHIIAGAYQYKGNYDSALAIFKLANQYYQQQPDMFNIICTLIDIGQVYTLKENYAQALTYLKQALSLAEQEGDSLHMISSLNGISEVYYNLAAYDKVLEYFLRCLKIGEERHDSSMLGGLYANMGSIYYNLGDYSTALEYDKKSLVIEQKMNNKSNISISLKNIGDIYNENLHEYSVAEQYANQAIEIAEEAGYKYGIVNGLILLGTIARNTSQYDKALEYLFEARSIYREYISNDELLEISIEIGNIYFFKNDYENSLKYCKTGLAKATALGRLKEIYYTDSILSRTYELRGNTDSALHYFKEYALYQDSVVNKDKETRIANLQIEYETEKKEQQISLLEKGNEVKDLKIQQSRIFNWGLGGLVVVVLLMALLFIRQNKLKNEHKTVVLEQKLFRLQMNPHFIFNVHSNILGFIENKNTDNAARYLSTFSKLLRTTLETSRNDTIYLEEEISMIKEYLDLQKLLYDNKFEYTVEIDDKLDPDEVTIPPMLIQPFIENAIQHGIGQKETKGHIFVRFKLEGKKLICEVEDNGIGRAKAWESAYKSRKDHKSLATSIVQDRIQAINKKMKQKIKLAIIDLKADNNESSGTKVVLDLPVNY